ncbi:MAG: hypothetical protein ABI131_00975 [Nostocoides sp.]
MSSTDGQGTRGSSGVGMDDVPTHPFSVGRPGAERFDATSREMSDWATAQRRALAAAEASDQAGQGGRGGRSGSAGGGATRGVRTWLGSAVAALGRR